MACDPAEFRAAGHRSLLNNVALPDCESRRFLICDVAAHMGGWIGTFRRHSTAYPMHKVPNSHWHATAGKCRAALRGLWRWCRRRQSQCQRNRAKSAVFFTASRPAVIRRSIWSTGSFSRAGMTCRAASRASPSLANNTCVTEKKTSSQRHSVSWPG